MAGKPVFHVFLKPIILNLLPQICVRMLLEWVVPFMLFPLPGMSFSPFHTTVLCLFSFTRRELQSLFWKKKTFQTSDQVRAVCFVDLSKYCVIRSLFLTFPLPYGFNVLCVPFLPCSVNPVKQEFH